ncbi:MAG: dienelactone hydrolase family protein [Ktedonobacteraceae bacterium]
MLEKPSSATNNTPEGQQVQANAGALTLPVILSIPDNARGIVLLAYGSKNIESNSPYAELANGFYQAELATLFAHLLTEEEETLDKQTQFFRFNVSILHQRIMGLTQWLLDNTSTQNLGIGYFGTGPTGAAALIAAAERPDPVHAVVVGNGRMDLAQPYLSRISAPTFLLVGERDASAVNSNREALAQIPAAIVANKGLETLPEVTQLFETSASLQNVIKLATQWFQRHLEPIV